jgi:nicotinate-nucleotide adenylyltransferase
MNIGLYFGSFNPIHNGHLILANHILNANVVDQVWFVVSPQNPLKEYTSLLNEHHRLDLVKIAIEGETNLKASNIEFKLPRPSYTIDTLTYMKEMYPNHEFQIIMGSDSYKNIKKWKNSDLLLKEHKLILFLRKGFDIEDVGNKNVILNEAPVIEISSTLIRKLLKERKSIRYLVPDVVYDEIKLRQYYQSTLENKP